MRWRLSYLPSQRRDCTFGNSFASHLYAVYECPYTRASHSSSSGADSGPRAGGLDEGADNAVGSDDDDDAAVGSHVDAGNAASSVSAPAPDLQTLLAGLLARVVAPGSALVSAPGLPGLLAAFLARLIALESLVASLPPQPAVASQALGAGAAVATTPSASLQAATPRAAPLQPAVDAQAFGTGAAGATTPSAPSEVATPSAAPAPPQPQAGLSDSSVPSRRAKLKESRARAKAATRAAREEAQAAAASAAARATPARAAKSWAKAQARKQAEQAARKQATAAAAGELKVLAGARAQAHIEAAALRSLGTDLALNNLLAPTPVPTRRCGAPAGSICCTTTARSPPLCASI